MKKIKIVIFIITIICITFVIYKYTLFKNYVNYFDKVENINHVEYLSQQIRAYTEKTYMITGRLPAENDIKELLYELDEEANTEFFLNENYNLDMDYDKLHIKLYSYGFSGKNNQLRNKLNIYELNKNIFLENMSFFNFLFSGIDLVFLDGALVNENCSHFTDYKTEYIKGGRIYSNDKIIQLKLDSLIHIVNLKPGFKKDFSNSTIYLYNGKALKNKCVKKSMLVDKIKKEELLKLLKINFSDYDYIKFSVTPTN